jgi:hypothetical protein
MPRCRISGTRVKSEQFVGCRFLAMALYYFDIEDNGAVFADDQGTECADLNQVKREAIRTLVEMVNESLPDGDQHTLRIKVRSEGGNVVLQVAINFEVEAEHRSTGRSPDPHF